MAGFLIVNPERANAYHTEWKNERVNELYAKERATKDGPERGAMFREMVKLSHDGAPSIFLFYPARPTLIAAMSAVSRCCRPAISASKT